MNNLVFLSEAQQVSMADDWFDLANESHFWMQWRFQCIRKYARLFPKEKHQILEIGCGGGTVMRQMENELGLVIDGCDLNLTALKKVEGVSGKLMVYNIFDRKPDMVNRYKAIMLLDVIEHIDDDKEFLRAAMQHLEKDGIVMINVPALKTLFSQYDVEAGHKRRYTRSMINELFQALDIEPIGVSYWGFLLLPIAVARKIYLSLGSKNIISKGFQPPGAVAHNLLKGLMKLETSICPLTFIGTSVLAVGRKRQA